MPQSLKIGILAESTAHQHLLRQVVAEQNCQIGCALNLEQLPKACAYDVDAWIVDIDLEAHAIEALENWLAVEERPVILGDGHAGTPGDEAHSAWKRRIKEKISSLAGSINLARECTQTAKHFWVLAASTGGPAAVNEFLCGLKAGLDIAFLYVQHTNEENQAFLAEVASRGCHYPARVVSHGDVLEPNKVAILPTAKEVRVAANGSLIMADHCWGGPYRPSADQVIANMAQLFGSHCGAIVFTGMGDDGAVGVRLLKRRGGRVWIQTPSSCVSDSMPQAVAATDCAEFSGTPAELAQRLNGLVEASSSIEQSA